MAFTPETFVICSKFQLFKASCNLWLYSTLDTLEDCLAEHYFQPRMNLKNQDSPEVGDIIQCIVEGSKLAYLKIVAKTEKPYNITVARTFLENEATLLSLITELQLDKASKSTDFVTPITDENLGITQTEQTELEEKIDLAANSGRMITAQGVWYAKMYSATVVPAPTIVGSNYADFSQVDGEGNPIIKIYNAVDTLFYQSQPAWQMTVSGTTFKTEVNHVWGTYVFSYDGADWSLDGNVVNMADYGITFAGTVTSGAVLSIQYGNWVLDETVTPPAEYDGYVPVTSKMWDITEQDGQQGGRVLWNHTSKEFTPYPTIVSFNSIEITGDSTVVMPATPSDDNIANVGFVKNTVGAARSIGDIFFTARTDSALNGAVECNGGIYDTTDFTGAQSIGNLLALGKLPYVSLATYATLLSTNGSVGVFGWDGVGTTPFRVPSLNDIFIETGTAAEVGDYLAPALPNPNINTTITVRTNTDGISHNYGNAGNQIVTGQAAGTFVQMSGLTTSSVGNSVYTGSTVQPNAVRYRAMVQLAVTATDEAVITCTAVTADVATLKSHEVIEFQVPSVDNNYTGYRKYADGYIEIWGRGTTNGGNATQVTLPVTMADVYYNILIQGQTSTDGYANADWHVMPVSTVTSPKSTTSFYAQANITGYNLFFYWEVKGMYSV